MATEFLPPDMVSLPLVSFVPPLESGDRLTRDEFERRYGAMPGVKKAELIEGIVYLPSPVKNSHGEPHSWLVTWLGVYTAATSGVRLSDNATVRLDEENEPQPDVQLRIDPTCGGQTTIGPDGYIEGAPELAVEIAGTSAAYDLHDKKESFRRNGVREYIVWRVYESGLDWFGLEDGAYVALAPDAEGVLHSRVFPGLRLDVAAMLKGDLARVLQELYKGTASPAHATFVRRLAEAQRPK